TDPNTLWPAAGIVNAAQAVTQGFEVDITWRPIDELTLALAYAFTDAEWDDFNYTDIRAQAGQSLRAKDLAICGNAQGDCSGAQLAGVPENAMTLIGNYTAPLTGEMEWFVNVIGSYQDERALFDQVNTPYVDSFWNWDAQLGLQTEQWTVQLYSTNLLDDDTARWAQGLPDFRDGMYGGNFGGEPRDEAVFAFLPPPRQIGLRASYRF
ncbi:MAG: TonB-dependent receptor, partial [Gammaproteobacteria bacterium]|nr:TonB-dependent receptor [Gammaproteobacteria bacterium]